MEALWWFLTLGLMLVGLIGTVVPLVPVYRPHPMWCRPQSFCAAVDWMAHLGCSHADDDRCTGSGYCERFSRCEVVWGDALGCNRRNSRSHRGIVLWFDRNLCRTAHWRSRRRIAWGKRSPSRRTFLVGHGAWNNGWDHWEVQHRHFDDRVVPLRRLCKIAYWRDLPPHQSPP